MRRVCRLPKRRLERFTGHPADNRFNYKPHRGRNVAAQRHCLRLNVEAILTFLKPADAVEPPDESCALALRKHTLFGGTVVGDLLDPFRLRDAIHPPISDTDERGFV